MGSMSAVLIASGSIPTSLPVATPGVIRHPSGIPPGSCTDRRLSSLIWRPWPKGCRTWIRRSKARSGS
jgi:hypothetical protein